MTDLFPRGIAQGKAFYDRVAERKKLKQNINHTIHTVLIAPRRYGKTSLMIQVLYENKTNHLWFDFMTITSREDVQAKILQKISKLVVTIAPATKKLKQLTAKYFSALNPEITLKIPGLVSLKLHAPEKAKEGIIEALISLDNLAKDLNKRLVIVLDEFQEILRIDKDSTLQAAIRHAAERSAQVTYLFSGSKHRPLRRMFTGKENPLYALCDSMELSKISDEEYIDFINKAAMEKWGSPLDTEILNQILSYSDRYPKYINALCGAIWVYESKPTSELVEELWHSYVLSRKTDIAEDLSDLTLNQRKLLQWLCFEPTTELYSKEILASLKMSQSSVQKAIEILLEKDFVIEEKNVYRVLDPIFISYFRMFS
jgi:AAA+ ATPase superfamily predicted ATPase